MKRLALVCSLLLLASCHRRTAPAGGSTSVVLYTSVDEPYVRPLVAQFRAETGIDVQLVTDSEASKTVGLTERLRAEKDHPKADVWWDNECFQTLRLKDDNVLAAYDSPSAADLPARYKDAGHLWAGSAIRIRVLVTSPKLANKPGGIRDLLKPELKDKIVIARPTAGTTGGHVAALYAAWGDANADAFFHALKGNGVAAVGGNSYAAEAVARGQMLAGLCDNDDAASAAVEVGKLDTIVPDQGEGGQGTLAMPCAVALVAGGPHPDAGRRLIDFLLTAKVDKALVDAKFAWCSARDAEKLSSMKLMDVDYEAVSRGMPAAVRRATAILDNR